MPNMEVTSPLPPSQAPELIQRYIAQFQQSQQAQAANALQGQANRTRQQDVDQTGTYNAGMLKKVQDEFAEVRRQNQDKELMAASKRV
jgi:hypothetical protein